MPRAVIRLKLCVLEHKSDPQLSELISVMEKTEVEFKEAQ